MSSDSYSFVADTFYPSLAQYGIIGICLYILFWISIIKKSNRILRCYGDIVLYKMCLLTVGFFFIESFTDSTFTNNRGLFMMMLLALFLSEYKKQKTAIIK